MWPKVGTLPVIRFAHFTHVMSVFLSCGWLSDFPKLQRFTAKGHQVSYAWRDTEDIGILAVAVVTKVGAADTTEHNSDPFSIVIMVPSTFDNPASSPPVLWVSCHVCQEANILRCDVLGRTFSS